jgi:hypothetical protein
MLISTLWRGEKYLSTLPRIEHRFLGSKVKVKFSLEQAMKAQRGSRGIALLFL